MQLAKEAGDSSPKVNDGSASSANTLDQRPRIGLRIADIVIRTQRADPTIKDLDSARAGSDLQASEIAEHIYEFSHQPPPHRLVGIHEFFCFEERTRRTGF